nr:zinc finger BED domain-containing protein DAYSLEEPER-like [Ziziphus jujuba var. spinosa]
MAEASGSTIGSTPHDKDQSSSTPFSDNSTPISTPQEIPSQEDINQTSIEVCDEDSSQVIGKRKLISVVWNHFKKVKIDGVDKAICNYCSKKLGGGSRNGTRHLHDHFKRCPLRTQKDIRQAILNPTKDVGGKVKVGTYTFDQENARKELANMIVLHEYPLSIVEHYGFRRGFMAITAHFIDDGWILQSRIIRFVYVPCPHTSEVLCNVFMDCILDWNIDGKLSTLTLDNCSTNDALVNLLLDKLPNSSFLLKGQFFHMRWNSTYLMLATALKYRTVFPRLKQRESLYKCLPSDQDWDLAKEVCERLELFYEVTEIFSGTKYPTANLFFPHICEIRMSICDWLTSSCEEIRLMAAGMISKFEKYWSETHGIMAIATLLDPRYKMKVIEYYFPLIYGDEGVHKIAIIRQICYDLVKEYQSKRNLSANVPNVLSSQSNMSPSGKKDRLAKFDLFVSSTTNLDNVKSELDRYLEEPVLPRSNDFDILAWWKVNAMKYPTLHNIARDILAIPVSTVASESAFSTSGRFVSPHRSRLHP